MKLTDMIKHPFLLDETEEGAMLLFDCSMSIRDALHYSKVFVRIHENYEFVTFHCGTKTVLIFEKMATHGQSLF